MYGAEKFDLGPVLDENGILWTKCGFPNELENSDASWYAAPCERLELLEPGPARVRIRTSGPHCRYGNTDVKARWKELGFEQTVSLGAETLTPGKGFVAAVEAGQLILQVLSQVKKDVPMAIMAR